MSAEKVRPICDGFAWIGQKFSTCDDCGHPAWDHDGMKRLRPDAGPFNDDAWEVRAWDDKVIATWLTHNLIDRARAVALLAHIDGPECGPDRAT